MNPTKSISTKSRIIILFLIGLFSLRAIAQQKVEANQIMRDIKNGKDIAYENVTIIGDLDFTYMDSKISELPRSKKWNGNDNKINELITVNVSFINCVFEGDVLAYIHDDNIEYTFTADFDQSVVFQKCKFNRKAMFKYSAFEDHSSFAMSVFSRASTFKYAEFEEKANFSNTVFSDDAIFKYSEFDNGVSFENAVFEESLNIKYLDVRGDFNINRMKVDEDIDSKYTKINGRSFSSYLLSSRD